VAARVVGNSPHLMAYDENLANRLRDLLADEGAITEKKMFGEKTLPT
jgi:TfoX/Sxy family transcriptional regulator of competence genes